MTLYLVRIDSLKNEEKQYIEIRNVLDFNILLSDDIIEIDTASDRIQYSTKEYMISNGEHTSFYYGRKNVTNKYLLD